MNEFKSLETLRGVTPTHSYIYKYIFFYGLRKFRQTLEMAQNIVNNQNNDKKLKLTITEGHKNCQSSVARNQKTSPRINV